MSLVGSLDLAALRSAYASGQATPVDVINEVYDRIAGRDGDNVWITLVPREQAVAAAAALSARYAGADRRPPLFGIPFAVKDNIDAAGLATTAAYPLLDQPVADSATLVGALLDSGALLIGKTNLDQFATGLNGTRSPYGTPVNPFDATRIPGGSSSGSAVAVSSGLVSFAIGTDTAGSGRVPAALTGTVGIKPSRGLVSTAGILPACRSLDCASIFALTVADGAQILALVAGVDPRDPWSRSMAIPDPRPRPVDLGRLRIGVPREQDVDFRGDAAYAQAYADVLAQVIGTGATVQEIDMTPFFAAGQLLYQGAWVAERYAAVMELAGGLQPELDPAVWTAIEGGALVTGAEVFADQERLRALQVECAAALGRCDVLLTPTVASSYTLKELADAPQERNAELGRFTTFGNLLDLAAIAVPAAIAANGMPFGVTVSGPAGSDALLASAALAIETLVDLPLAATGRRAVITEPVDRAAIPVIAQRTGGVLVSVVGAHLSGMPLNGDLVRLGASLEAATTTSADYRLYALADTVPPKPGLLRVADDGGAIAVEVYRMSTDALGALMTQIPAPLGIGRVQLADGSVTHGFLCEPYALAEARDITAFGGWRAYVSS
ncbi:MAG: Amidase [Jatrophihabitantaceae bacterium]|nr:Amidase [Jatrophihabitantaceae bacterium]